jgi:YD repeat-containing protein
MDFSGFDSNDFDFFRKKAGFSKSEYDEKKENVKRHFREFCYQIQKNYHTDTGKTLTLEKDFQGLIKSRNTISAKTIVEDNKYFGITIVLNQDSLNINLVCPPDDDHNKFEHFKELVAAKNALNGGHYDTFTYDLLGRKVSEKTAQAEIDYPEIAYTAKWDYDFRGNVVKEYNANGNYITYAYDGLGRNVSVTDYSNNTTTITYDNLGRALTQSVPFENISGTVYSAVTKTDYDRNGNVIKTRVQNNEPGAAANWSMTTNEYNNRNFLTSATNYLDNTSENVVTYTYNGAGSVLTQTTGTHTIELKTVVGAVVLAG